MEGLDLIQKASQTEKKPEDRSRMEKLTSAEEIVHSLFKDVPEKAIQDVTKSPYF